MTKSPVAKAPDLAKILPDSPAEMVARIQARMARRRGESLRDQVLVLTRGTRERGRRTQDSSEPSTFHRVRGLRGSSETSSPFCPSSPSPVTPLPPTRPRDPPSLPLTPRPHSPSVPRRAASRFLVALPRG